RAAWTRLEAFEGFQRVREAMPLLATWDDHDYGLNDAGREWALRETSQEIFLDWLGVAEDSPRREREGVYHAASFGPAGRRVQVILLDTRYHRSPLAARSGPRPEGVTGEYVPTDDRDQAVLGEAQWTWLEEQLRAPADLRVVASSIQVIAEGHGWECWGNFPREKERLMHLLGSSAANGVLFVSGDRHSAELSVQPTTHDGLDAGYDLYDLTASALNRPRKWQPERNDQRLGDLWTAANFGVIEVDWAAETPRVSLEVRDAAGQVRIHHALPMTALEAPRGEFAERVPAAPRPLERIAFGSCNDQRQPTPLWDAVVEAEPELFLFLGDNVYGDTTDMDHLRAQYALLAAQPGFQRLRADVPILATWDDHDFGWNDAGAEYPRKRASKEILLDFFEEPADSPRRGREGLYGAWLFGPPEERVQVILLDLRSFKSPWVRRHVGQTAGDGHPGGYAPNLDPAATMLGEAQWAWLAEQLRAPARLRLIGTSLQALSEECHWEGWAMMPLERARLLRTIRDSNASGVVLLSGDTHWAELTRVDPWNSGVAYPLFELTSSGLNQGWEWTQIANPHRVGPPIWTPNWGLVEIDWARDDPLVTLRASAADGSRLEQQILLSELEPSARR
ncbi:MAG: alkaline phosphatase D family protein, partial [Planctomycetota bacterium]